MDIDLMIMLNFFGIKLLVSRDKQIPVYRANKSFCTLRQMTTKRLCMNSKSQWQQWIFVWILLTFYGSRVTNFVCFCYTEYRHRKEIRFSTNPKWTALKWENRHDIQNRRNWLCTQSKGDGFCHRTHCQWARTERMGACDVLGNEFCKSNFGISGAGCCSGWKRW